MTTHPARHDLVEALRAVRDAITDPVNHHSIVCTVWMPIGSETVVDFINAALASEAASQVPADGRVLVPKEPTEAMVQAIAWADWKGDRDLGWADGYRIMLEAAPDQEGPADGK